ncbi:hypothetical protein P879_11865 [Paragonimus westermani]|uniref:Uncharacterized protein n=1 Tax=Paragonimus westermani TaxID=34504 RepID=A0A8T0D5R2_9TREM|nr:hypothetical protein P879_11865 [Paragonimus westermani]
MAISVCEPEPGCNVSDNHGRSPPLIVYITNDSGRLLSVMVTIPPLGSPRSRAYCPLPRRMNRGFTTPPGRSHRNLVLFVPSIACPRC